MGNQYGINLALWRESTRRLEMGASGISIRKKRKRKKQNENEKRHGMETGKRNGSENEKKLY